MSKIQKQKSFKYIGTLGKYKILRKIESGSQATVLLGKDQANKKVAIKVFKDQKIFKREIKYVKRIGNHEAIIKTLDIVQESELSIKFKNQDKCQSQSVNAIVMEVGKIDLFGVITKCGSFSEPTCRYYFKKLLSALNHCHENNIAHCDIKLENIIFDRCGNIKLIDFGLSHKIQNKGFGQYRKLLGTYGYMAPEIHKSEFYNIKQTDIFSLAVILFILVLGSPPFQQALETDSHYQLLCNEPEAYLNFMDSLGDCSDEFKDFIFKMLRCKPNQRLSYKQIIKHPWYNQKSSDHLTAVVELNNKLLQDYNQQRTEF